MGLWDGRRKVYKKRYKGYNYNPMYNNLQSSLTTLPCTNKFVFIIGFSGLLYNLAVLCKEEPTPLLLPSFSLSVMNELEERAIIGVLDDVRSRDCL